MLKICVISIALALLANIAMGQTVSLFGKVQDRAGKHEPLPFVKISTKKKKNTTIADIDGRWQLTGLNQNDTVVFSYLGYKTIKVPVDSLVFGTDNIISMTEQSRDMETVVILPGINPAERIIKMLLKNKPVNDWRYIYAFNYTSYNHFVITRVDGDSTSHKVKDKTPQLKVKDATKMDSFFKKQDLFIIETVEETKYKAPDNFRKNVTGTKTSGFKNPIFSQVASQFQDFDIYKDLIEIFGKAYISPIENGAIKDYLFELKDTLWPGNGDTIFAIAYQPRNGKRFNGFKGIMYISSRQYAVQDFMADPSGPDNEISIKIEQQFEWVDSSHWFPVKVNSTLKFYDVQNSSQKIAGVGKSYFTNINLNPDLQRNRMGNIAFEVAPNAIEKDSAFWKKYRNRPLLKRDQNTFHIIDSIGKAENLDLKVKIFESLVEGRVPIWKFDLDLNKIIMYHAYETTRLGLGLYTNDKLSQYFSVGGYWGYGFGDKAQKYGGSMDIMPVKASFFRFGVAYSNDITEIGSVGFPLEKQQSLYGNYRDVYVNDMVTNITKSAYLRWRMLNYLQTQLSFKNTNTSVHDNYKYIAPDNIEHTNFNFTEAIFTFRYAYKEKLIKMPGKTFEQPTSYPVVLIQYTHGIKDLMGGDFNYQKIDLKIDKSFNIKLLGKSTFQVKAGKTFGDVPLVAQYNGYADYEKLFGLASKNTFETMRMNEFFSSQYVCLFYKHSFEKLLFKVGPITPVVSIAQNMAIGSLNNPNANTGIAYKTMEKGYFESGITIDDIIGTNTTKYGVGFFYRYGPYAFSRPIDNFALKLTITSIYF